MKVNFLNLGRVSHMVQHFHGQLSGLVIEQKEELPRENFCIRDCQQYLDMPDVQTEPDVVCCLKFLKNENHSMYYFRSLLVIQIDLFGAYVQIQVNHMNNY